PGVWAAVRARPGRVVVFRGWSGPGAGSACLERGADPCRGVAATTGSLGGSEQAVARSAYAGLPALGRRSWAADVESRGPLVSTLELGDPAAMPTSLEGA